MELSPHSSKISKPSINLLSMPNFSQQFAVVAFVGVRKQEGDECTLLPAHWDPRLEQGKGWNKVRI